MTRAPTSYPVRNCASSSWIRHEQARQQGHRRAAGWQRSKDHVAPVAGQQLRAPTDLDWNRVLAGMDKKARAKASKRLMGAHPDVRRVKRDHVRLGLAVLLIGAAFVDAGAALGLAVNNTISWGDRRDWLTLALVPLTPGIAVALAFWYPTKEIE
jgi:hypothetical protein